MIIIRPGGAIVQIGDKVLGYVGKRDKEKLEEYRNSRKLLDWITDKPKESELSKLKLLAKELWEEIEAYKRNSRS